jgi:hypothetical protein
MNPSPPNVASAPHMQVLRRIFMRSMLSFCPFIEAICGLAAEVLPGKSRLIAAIEAMRRAVQDLHEGGPGVSRQAYERAREDLACALDEVDEQGLLADLVVADLIGIEAGQESGLSLKLEPPPRNVSFLRYVTTVRRNHQAIWTALFTAT